ncbi:hypothetical protein OIU84_019934 [Salix udensis]|uniref:Uncharacterized protein n=1 Tax=Salix udensis TaxID=889485 RepID=A0AAD6L083_9ROSI|nr:hypothetical protein OIU84_019934 [Salix udensis]
MSSKGTFQQFQSSGSLSVSLQQRMEFKITQKELGHRETGASQSESEFNLRKSLAWDSAFFTSPGVLDPEELETLRPVRNNGVDECALRKSLAWDSAFFTSSGVLNAEELSLVNGGFRPSEAHLLPWDRRNNMRAFMQKSHEAPSNTATSTGKVSKENELRRGNTSTILDASSRLRVAPNKESKSFLKPPKILCRARTLSTAPNKRVSLGVNHVKLENKGAQAVSGKNSKNWRTKILSKKTCIRGSCSIVPSSPSSVVPTAGKDFGGFCCAPNFTGKSPPDSLRRTVTSQVSSSVSISRTPLKHSSGNKNDLMKIQRLYPFVIHAQVIILYITC